MIKILFLVTVCSIVLMSCMGSSSGTISHDQARRDSLRAKRSADSLRFASLLAKAEYPLIKGGKWSGIIPVTDPTEIPDPNHEYKLLFEFTARNPDSLSKEINQSLDEVIRVLNLHVASGIPKNKITPVVLIHGPGIEAVTNDETYKKKHSIDNPNIKFVRELENAGTKFIVCGQAMAFQNTTKDQLLPEIKVSLTAQTVLSNYQSQGYVRYSIDPDK